MSSLVIKTNPNDNVAIVASLTGLQKDTIIIENVIAIEQIPMGHKIALHTILKNEPIIRYGEIIGNAIKNIEKGSWVNEKNMNIPPAPDLKKIIYKKNIASNLNQKTSSYTFKGYKNKDGSVGTKNILGITTSVQCVAGITQFIENKIRKELLPKYPNVDGVVAFNHSYGCGVAIDAPAAIIPIRTIQNIAQNPNFGDEIMVIGLGCEKLRPEKIITPNKEGSILYLQDEQFNGFNEIINGILKQAEQHLIKLNKRKREDCFVSELVVGMQCGGSDAFSGLTGNPVVGFAADLIIKEGGTVFFSEVTEVRDAIHLLVPRAINKNVADKLIQEIDWYDKYLQQGQADRSANTTPGNKGGGLSNIVEKALGSVVKSGTSPIVDVVAPGEKYKTKGLNFVATPASDFVCGTLQLAAGMNLHVFITGRGTPYGLSMVPVIKISSNSKLANRWFDLIDFDAGPIALGQETIAEMGHKLFLYILDVASGKTEVATDKLGLYNDLVLFNPGPLT